jgi:hypothetical protein
MPPLSVPVPIKPISFSQEGQHMTEATFSEATKKLSDDLMRVAHRLADQRKHTDHYVAALLHRLETTMRDCGRQIADVLATMPKSTRDKLDAFEQK